MDLGLRGKRALVLGATRGLGRGVAQVLAEEGAAVILAARAQASLEATAAEIRDRTGAECAFWAADTGDASSMTRLAEVVIERHGGADILVTNTGGPEPTLASQTDADAWRKAVDAMFTNTAELIRRLLPGMQERRWGRILNIVSSSVVQPVPNLALSNVVRAGIAAYSKTLAGEVAADGVTVNCILPGRIDTERVAALDAKAAERQGTTVEEIARAKRQTIPVGRYGTVREFADVAAFLCSARASYVTGSLIRVDGGMIQSI